MILLYKGKSTVSRIIQWQTFGPYSHAAWWCQDSTVIESWHKGGVTHNAGPGTLHTPGTEIDVFGVPDVDEWIVEHSLQSQVGKGYDFAPVLRGFPLRLNRDNPDRWFCSELVFWGVEQGGVRLLLDVPAFKVHPTLLSYSPLKLYQGTLIVQPDHSVVLIKGQCPGMMFSSPSLMTQRLTPSAQCLNPTA